MDPRDLNSVDDADHNPFAAPRPEARSDEKPPLSERETSCVDPDTAARYTLIPALTGMVPWLRVLACVLLFIAIVCGSRLVVGIHEAVVHEDFRSRGGVVRLLFDIAGSTMALTLTVFLLRAAAEIRSFSADPSAVGLDVVLDRLRVCLKVGSLTLAVVAGLFALVLLVSWLAVSAISDFSPFL